MKKLCQNDSGTHAAIAPAISKPMIKSRRIAAHSMTKTCDTAVNPRPENRRRRNDPSPCTDMSIAAWPSIDPASPRSACSRAASMTRARTNNRNNTASTTIMIGPPTNSAAVNCQPISSARITPSSTTRFVEAISNAIAAVKFAPLRNSERASATAAYEHDDDAAPSPVATASVRGRSSPRRPTIADLRTTACTTADSANPRIKAHRISHVIDPASASARPMASITSIASPNPPHPCLPLYTPKGYTIKGKAHCGQRPERTTRMRRRLLTIGVAALAMLTTLTACNSDSSHEATHSGSTSSSVSSSVAAQQHNQADVTFAQHMIPHHQQAIEMSDTVLAKQGIDARVIDMANRIKAAQGPEIQQMQSWLSQWGVPTMPMTPGSMAGHDVSGMMSEQDMNDLKSADGVEASKLFLTQMIAHHQGAITMGTAEIKNGQYPPAVPLAQSIVTGQQQEITEMQGILASL